MKQRSELQQAPNQEDIENSSTTASPPPMALSIASSTHFNPTQWFLRGLTLSLAATFSAVIGATVALTLPLPKAIDPQGDNQPLSIADLWSRGFGYTISHPVNILVMGIDLPLDLPEGQSSDNVFAGRSDTMLLVRIDPTANTVNVLSIPRDTQVEIPGEGVMKINHANVVGGSELSAEVVSANLNGVSIDRYVRVSTGAFRELVDLLGGVRIFVPERMVYEDQTQKLQIDLYPGWQTLNGEQAEQFARFRNDATGDIGRVQRQQQVIRALRERLTNPAVLPRIPQAIQLFQKYIDTNLTTEEMLALAHLGLGLEQNNFRMVLLPGRFSTQDEFIASYWLIDPGAKDQVMQEYFDISSVSILNQEYDSPNDLRIAVQNASHDPQVGSDVVAYLQDQGFYNVYLIDDWPDQQDQTQIIAQRGDLEGAAFVESILGIGQVVPSSTGELDSDLTIRVGDDWASQPHI